MADPQRILEEAKYHSEQLVDEARAGAVRKALEKIEDQQGKLAEPYVKGSLPQNILETKSEELSQQRRRLEAENRILDAERPKGLDLDWLAANLPDAATRVKRWVEEASEDDMELILRALNIQVAASREQVQIEGIVPIFAPKKGNLVTTEQTSASRRGCTLRSRWV